MIGVRRPVAARVRASSRSDAISPATKVIAWIDQGSLLALRIGRRVRIKRSDFDSLVEAGYSGPKPLPPAGIWEGEVPLPVAPTD
jgi:excisionase family DNA binding protein